MIVVVGSPAARISVGTTAAGMPAAIARAAATAGAGVQLVGRVGEDATGEAVLLDLAASGVGHVALLRTAGAATPVEAAAVASSGQTETDSDTTAPGIEAQKDADLAATRGVDEGLPLDAADLDLALRYLPDYGVLVVAADLDEAAWATVAGAAAWSAAALVAVVPSGEAAPGLPPDATILARPAADEDGAFADLVGRYAAALDAGTDAATAFAQAAADEGWASVET